MGLWKIKIRTLLLSLFLFTIVVSSSSIIWFTYVKYSKSIHELSLGYIGRASERIYEKIGCIIQETESLPLLGFSFFKEQPRISPDNHNLIFFFLELLQHDPNLSSYLIGLPDGSFLVALSANGYREAFTSVPPNAAFLTYMSNPSSHNASQIRTCYDKALNVIETIVLMEPYDLRTRPWYTGAEQTKNLFWTDLYTHAHSISSQGLAVAQPFYDKDGGLIAILGADLSLDLFSRFLENEPHQALVFILDKEGKILLPKNPNSAAAKILSSTHQSNKKHAFSFEVNGETYLESWRRFPTTHDLGWHIVYIAPRTSFLSGILATQQQAVLLSLCILAAAMCLAALLALHISKPIVKIADEINRMARLDLNSNARVPSHIAEIDLIDTSVASMRTAFRSFGHYVPKEIATQLMRKEHEISLGGEKKTISIFFTDIANFTSISESLPIETVNALLTEYFKALSPIILKCGGTIDKYIGDSIMSLWGAPDDVPDYAAKACTAALLCEKRLEILNEKLKAEGMPECQTRMGIRTGTVIAGNFGTSERMNYSVIGDAVNTASRLQLLNKTYRTRIIIGDETMKAAGPQFLVRPLGVVEVRGKKEKLGIFELAAKRGEEKEILPTPLQTELCAAFTEAYNTFETGNLYEAKRLFLKVHERFPDDYPTILYLEQILQ